MPGEAARIAKAEAEYEEHKDAEGTSKSFGPKEATEAGTELPAQTDDVNVIEAKPVEAHEIQREEEKGILASNILLKAAEESPASDKIAFDSAQITKEDRVGSSADEAAAAATMTPQNATVTGTENAKAAEVVEGLTLSAQIECNAAVAAAKNEEQTLFEALEADMAAATAIHEDAVAVAEADAREAAAEASDAKAEASVAANMLELLLKARSKPRKSPAMKRRTSWSKADDISDESLSAHSPAADEKAKRLMYGEKPPPPPPPPPPLSA